LGGTVRVYTSGSFSCGPQSCGGDLPGIASAVDYDTKSGEDF
jgi:hypothetical protein